jgi:hypothetical protein
MGNAPIYTADWSARLERMMEQYSEMTRLRRLQLAMKQWRMQEARQVLAALEKPPERIH